MIALTPAERRGALVLVLLLALGAARDLVTIAHPPRTPPPAWEDDPGAGGGTPPEPATAPPTPVPAAGVATPGPRVDLNHADAAALDALPGIGPVLAGRIVDHRRMHGPYRTVDDLLAVPGIGPRLLERLRGRAGVGTTDSSALRTGTPGRRVQISLQRPLPPGR